LTGKTVIVTGCTRGIGKALLEDLVRREAHVIMACRDIDLATSIAKQFHEKYIASKISVRRLDLASFASIKQFAKQVTQEEPMIHILVNNAGAMSSPERKETEDGNEWTIGVNYFGPVLLTLLLLPKIKEKILFVGSSSHGFVERIPFDDINSKKWVDGYMQSFITYAKSKASLLCLCYPLARKLYTNFGIKVYSVDPGVSDTDVTRDLPKLRSSNSNSLASRMATRTNGQSADSIMHIILSQSPYDQSVLHFRDGKPLETGSCTRDTRQQQDLWKMTRNVLDIDVMDKM